MKRKNINDTSRRKAIKLLFSGGVGMIAGAGFLSAVSCKKNKVSGEKISLLSPEGKLVEVDKSDIQKNTYHLASREKSRKGIPGQKFVLVVDLAKCKNAQKCVEACNKHHQLTPDRSYITVLKMQDNKRSSPYWMPKKCFQCDNPPCVKVCPVSATYKRSDGIVLVDNKRCIGCRFCMAACPYSARVFNWKKPEPSVDPHHKYSPETSVPRQIGTVEKCDFCPDMLRQKKLPHCVTACPNGVIYFGNAVDDAVTNGVETVRLSTLLREKAGYRYLEELGTEPNVYYLPPVDRIFPFKEESGEDNT